MVRQCGSDDFEAVHAIINDGASAYRGVIPEDCWREPYMARDELRREIEAGISFWGEEDCRELVGVMGIQEVDDVTLIRHAYVRTAAQRKGTGARLLAALQARASQPLLVGTWAAADWAIRFYERHGFELVGAAEKDRLLRAYWSIPDRQIETSVVLVGRRGLDSHAGSETGPAVGI